jgi:hypothetical protein
MCQNAMTEREYLIASELKAVRIALDIVGPLLSVHPGEKRQVFTLLQSWESMLVDEITKRRNAQEL